MYQFHYDVWMKNFPDSKLLFTDTDSLAYATSCENIEDKLLQLKDHFDFSNMEKSNPLYNPTNMMSTGYFKDELSGKVFTGFAGLKAKLYALSYEETDGKKIESKSAKGIKKRTKNRQLTFSHYKSTILTGDSVTVPMNYIISEKHKVFSYSRKNSFVYK